jgi:purine-binding chemotaxis protein CheW
MIALLTFQTADRRFALPASLLLEVVRAVAMRVDRALDLVTIEEGLIQPVDSVALGAEYVAGLAKLPDALLVIHDLERFLSPPEAHHLETALAEAGA